MEKFEIVNALARERNLRRYLEICTPLTGGKFAFVDPSQFAVRHRLMYNRPDTFDDGMPVTFPCRSPGSEDVVRAIHAVQPERERYDIIFVDSFHTYRASIVDLHGALSLLRPGGVMVVHDCNPDDPSLVGAAFQEGSWCGVTYGAFIDFVLAAQPAGYCVVDSDYGCGVVFSQGAALPAGLSTARPPQRLVFEWVLAREDDRTRFPFFARHRQELLNLVSPARFRQLALPSAGSDRAVAASALGAVRSSAGVQAPELKVLTAGAFRSSVVALGPQYEKASGNTLVIDNDTVGALAKRIEAGEGFDVVVMTPAAVDELAGKGKVLRGSRVSLAQVGVGVMVKAGAPLPDISTVDAFKKAVLAAKSVSFIDPASGGSSGIYVAKLLERLGIADQVKPKEKLKQGGYVADYIESGEAELGIHQISEIVPVQGATLVGPLPAEIQNYTTYAAGISASAEDNEAAKALVKLLSGPAAAPVIKEKGMEPAS